MKVLVIGSKGFIGQSLSVYFRSKGFDVWETDVIAEYENPDRFILVEATNPDFSVVFQQEKYDLCINCSGAASVPDSLSNPAKDFILNTVNVFNILEAIRKNQPHCKFINISSAAVYGNPEVLPISEESRPNPLSPYGCHKLLAEHICKEFWDLFQIQTCSLRIFSVYGPGLKKQLFWDLFRKARTGDPFFLFGTGKESRDYIYILDLVRAIDLVAQFSNFKADIINIANGEEVLIEKAVSTFFGFFDLNIQYEFSGDTRSGDPLNWKADIKKLKSFGYKPEVDLQIGLKNYFNWIQSNGILPT
jgi:dTDP-glucose 4,6-dehydratase/UDP-glucose 4-epimerase